MGGSKGAGAKGGSKAEKGGSKGEKGERGEDGGKGGKSKPNYTILERPYKDIIQSVLSSTQVRPGDFDDKAVQYLDYLHENGGRAAEACLFLKQTAGGVEREEIARWRAYVYTLLKKYDEKMYHEWKESLGGGNTNAVSRRVKADKEVSTLNKDAPEFVPQGFFGVGQGAPQMLATPQLAPMPLPYPMAQVPLPYPSAQSPYAALGLGGYMVPGPPPPQQAPNTVATLSTTPAGSTQVPQTQSPAHETAPPMPPTDGVSLPSLGSAWHANGSCKPCAFFHTKGCASGMTCEFCHLCGKGAREKKRRQKGSSGPDGQ